MQTELIRTELQRVIRQSPFRPFILTMKGGERALIEHSENVAFDPRPGSTTDFYVLTGSLRMFCTFEAISSISYLSDNGAPPEQQARV